MVYFPKRTGRSRYSSEIDEASGGASAHATEDMRGDASHARLRHACQTVVHRTGLAAVRTLQGTRHNAPGRAFRLQYNTAASTSSPTDVVVIQRADTMAELSLPHSENHRCRLTTRTVGGGNECGRIRNSDIVQIVKRSEAKRGKADLRDPERGSLRCLQKNQTNRIPYCTLYGRHCSEHNAHFDGATSFCIHIPPPCLCPCRNDPTTPSSEATRHPLLPQTREPVPLLSLGHRLANPDNLHSSL